MTIRGFVISLVAVWSLVLTADSSRGGSLPSATSGILGSVINSIPTAILDETEKQAFKEYLRVLGGNQYADSSLVGLSNSGLNNHFESLLGGDEPTPANRCFQTKAVSFYKDVSLYLRKAAGLDDSSPSENWWNMTGEKHSLFAKAGERGKTQIQPGWLWKLAIQHANGDAAGALSLIGMCGHDDAHIATFRYMDESEETKKEIQEQVSALEEKKKLLERELKSALKQPDPATFVKAKSAELSETNELLYIWKNQTGLRRTLRCPPAYTDFFLPGGLGSDVDISATLKKKVNAVQNPDGNSRIPAKHYHVYGSAFMTCNLISNGFDPEKAVKVQKQAARFYRGIRICEASSGLLMERSEMERSIDLRPKEGMSVEDIILNRLAEKDEGGSSIGYLFASARHVMDQDRAMAKRKITARLARMDAAFLYNLWYVGAGDVLTGKRFWCSDIRLGGPKNLLDVNSATFSWFQRPKGWSKERYDAAAKHLATWDVDFEWTLAQHEVGAKFAAKHCKQGQSATNPFQALCGAKSENSKIAPVETAR